VDLVIVVDDASSDGTAQAALAVGDTRVCCVQHARNAGVGAAIVTGYRAALERGADVLIVMAGDDQMDPRDLPSLLDAVAGGADYVKGNRFRHPLAADMPRARRVAGRLLSAATRLATRLAVDDCQCGYTALSASAARSLPLAALWPRYGYPNDLLGMAAAQQLKVSEVTVRPVYADENSGIRAWHAAVVLYVIGRRWYKEHLARVAQRTGSGT
jgi:glycosyltransferase involved in cell wall biosynthesis